MSWEAVEVGRSRSALKTGWQRARGSPESDTLRQIPYETKDIQTQKGCKSHQKCPIEALVP
jgi:hypothetical protein